MVSNEVRQLSLRAEIPTIVVLVPNPTLQVQAQGTVPLELTTDRPILLP